MKSKIVSILRMIGGFIVLFGYLLPLYLTDRVISVPFIWLKSENLITWVRTNELITNSAIRVGASGVIGFMIWLFI